MQRTQGWGLGWPRRASGWVNGHGRQRQASSVGAGRAAWLRVGPSLSPKHEELWGIQAQRSWPGAVIWGPRSIHLQVLARPGASKGGSPCGLWGAVHRVWKLSRSPTPPWHSVTPKAFPLQHQPAAWSGAPSRWLAEQMCLEWSWRTFQRGWGQQGALPWGQGVSALAIQAAARADGKPQEGAEEQGGHLGGRHPGLPRCSRVGAPLPRKPQDSAVGGGGPSAGGKHCHSGPAP